MNFIGIDCGLNGALVTINKNTIHSMIEMPTKKHDHKKVIDIEKLSHIFNSDNKRQSHIAIVEDPGGHAPSASGLRSMTYSFAVIKTLLVANKIPHHCFYARKWQSEFFKKPKDLVGKFDTKKAALDSALKIWPNTDWRRTQRSKNAFDGFVDAALIAEYGRRRELS